MFDPSTGLNLDDLRARLAKMDDFELKLFGRAAAYMTSPGANLDAAARRAFALQLEEAREEWWRRHPMDHESNSW